MRGLGFLIGIVALALIFGAFVLGIARVQPALGVGIVVALGLAPVAYVLGVIAWHRLSERQARRRRVVSD